jgi:hypothetical protein
LSDTYGIETAPGEDDGLILAVAVAIDEIAHNAHPALAAISSSGEWLILLSSARAASLALHLLLAKHET